MYWIGLGLLCLGIVMIFLCWVYRTGRELMGWKEYYLFLTYVVSFRLISFHVMLGIPFSPSFLLIFISFDLMLFHPTPPPFLSLLPFPCLPFPSFDSIPCHTHTINVPTYYTVHTPLRYSVNNQHITKTPLLLFPLPLSFAPFLFLFPSYSIYLMSSHLMQLYRLFIAHYS